MTAVLAAVGDLVDDIVVRLAGPVNAASDTDAVVTRRLGGSAANVAVTLVVEATTVPGENVFVVGSSAELGSWNTANAVPLATGPGVYPRWSTTVSLPAGAAVMLRRRVPIARSARA